MAEIRSYEELAKWLADRPASWGQIVLARHALRLLPVALDVPRSSDDGGDYELGLFRSSILVWSADFLTDKKLIALENSADHLFSLSIRNAKERDHLSAFLLTSNFSQLIHYIRDADWRVLLGGLYENIEKTNNGNIKELLFEHEIISIENDCNWLEAQKYQPGSIENLGNKPLWLTGVPQSVAVIWIEIKRKLLTRAASFQIWLNWFDRRIAGEVASFDIPGDRERREDQRIIARLESARNEDFWNKGAVYVNTTLQSWLDETRNRVALSESAAILPPQNPNAIVFRQDINGKIAVDSSIDLNALRTDPDARDRHSELQRLALALKSRCQGSNAGARLTGLLENFIQALGDCNENQRPSLLVQRGNRLDVEYRAYSDPAHLLSPLADDVLLDLGSLVSGIHMHVMSEPVLRERATAMLGPDAKPVLIAPNEIKAVIQEADEQGILADDVREVVEEAAEIAPAVPDPENRFTIWSTETLTNLIIEVFAIAMRHPIETAIVGGVASILPTGLDLGTAVVAAGYLLHRREWIESRLGNSPTWKALFIELCNRMDKFMPPHE